VRALANTDEGSKPQDARPAFGMLQSRMTPEVSILVPSYNHARFLPAALEGVLAQTFENWELILIDDGSTDDSVEVARSFKDPRIQVHVNEQNLGTYGTQQKALDMARGQCIAILNSDDLWAPTKLERQTQTLQQTPEATFCYVLGWKIDPDGEVDETDDVHADWPTTHDQELLPHLLFENRVLASGVLFRREGLRFEPSCRYSGDWVALLEAARRGPCVCVPERMTFWRLHGSNTFTASQRQLIEEIRVREAIQRSPRWFVPRLSAKDVRRGLARNAVNLIALYSVFLDGSAAQRAAIAALKLHPEKQAVLKRSLAAFLPVNRLRGHLWGDKLSGAKIDEPPARREIRTQPPLSFDS
jgi:glycosyltransferase involved in cell wall biosynthesis